MTRALVIARVLFGIALLVTLVCLLAPADAVLAAKVWAASWLPMVAALDAADATAWSDKLVHASLFAVLGFLAARSWLQPGQRWRVVVALLLLGALTEVLQSMIPGRGASFADWMADAVGLALGWMLWQPAPAPLRPLHLQAYK
ncbi:MAG: VanZ family protein [Simplicispira suum]|uniref:VanZ family protein n=1 Tax=Simplicispira suum TaxID=2109915 RepID=UPI001C6C2AA2|nr:VanZ family protein [Simplicispira suum]MBW7832171.1 VanZ family protein [Simplicispira suum]